MDNAMPASIETPADTKACDAWLRLGKFTRRFALEGRVAKYHLDRNLSDSLASCYLNGKRTSASPLGTLSTLTQDLSECNTSLPI